MGVEFLGVVVDGFEDFLHYFLLISICQRKEMNSMTEVTSHLMLLRKFKSTILEMREKLRSIQVFII